MSRWGIMVEVKPLDGGPSQILDITQMRFLSNAPQEEWMSLDIKQEPVRPQRGPGRPAKGYRLADGTRVPSVTTVLSRFKEAGGLIHWAWQLGIDGQDYRRVRDDAADAGNLAHALIEAHLCGTAYECSAEERPHIDQATQALESFKQWESGTGVTWSKVEWPMVSELLRFGGTCDAIATVNSAEVILDLKSGNRIYPEVIAQCAGYRHLAGTTGGAYVIRTGKELCTFAAHYYPPEALDIGWEYFRHALRLYELDKKLKKVSGL